MSKKKRKKKNKKWDFPVAKTAEDLKELLNKHDNGCNTIGTDSKPTPVSYHYNVLYEYVTKKTVSQELDRIKHTQIISDPFPEQSNYEHDLSSAGIMGIFISKPEEISIWKAFRMGYDKAYAEILTAIGEKEIK